MPGPGKGHLPLAAVKAQAPGWKWISIYQPQIPSGSLLPHRGAPPPSANPEHGSGCIAHCLAHRAARQGSPSLGWVHGWTG